MRRVLSAIGMPPMYFQVPDGEGRMKIIDNRLAVLEWDLKRHVVSPAIIERVLRLNPDGDKGYIPLRGIHYTEPGRWLGLLAAASKGEIIRRFGREVFDRIPREAYIKRGRRIFVSEREVMAAKEARDA